MEKTSSISDYERIATLTKSAYSDIDVYVATYKYSKNAEEYFIVNSFKHGKSNQETFKKLFQLFSSESRPSDMQNFLTDSTNFFAIFKYDSYVSIADVFSDEKNTYDYKERCTHLNAILMKLSQLNGLPDPALACVSDLENISLDKNLDVFIRYNFENYIKYSETPGQEIIYNNIADLIEFMLATELKPSKIPVNSLYVKPLQIVVQKCRKMIYQNIPELIIDIKKAEKLCDKTDSASIASDMVSKKKQQAKKYLQGAIALVLIAVVVVILQPLIIDTTNQPSSSVGSIGEKTYNQSSTIDDLVSIESSPSRDTSSPIDFSMVTIPANADIAYDEYIVQYGDTISSICQAKYNNANLANAVQTFNAIEYPNSLNVGSIIRLPASSVIESFVSAVSTSPSSSTSTSQASSSSSSPNSVDITFN